MKHEPRFRRETGVRLAHGRSVPSAIWDRGGMESGWDATRRVLRRRMTRRLGPHARVAGPASRLITRSAERDDYCSLHAPREEGEDSAGKARFRADWEAGAHARRAFAWRIRDDGTPIRLAIRPLAGILSRVQNAPERKNAFSTDKPP